MATTAFPCSPTKACRKQDCLFHFIMRSRLRRYSPIPHFPFIFLFNILICPWCIIRKTKRTSFSIMYLQFQVALQYKNSLITGLKVLTRTCCSTETLKLVTSTQRTPPKTPPEHYDWKYSPSDYCMGGRRREGERRGQPKLKQSLTLIYFYFHHRIPTSTLCFQCIHLFTF